MGIINVDEFGAPYMDIGYRPRFMWDVGASEQDITNVLEGIGGRGGYGTVGPPAMGWYGTPVTAYPVNTAPNGCSSCRKRFGADNGGMGVPVATLVTFATVLGVLGLAWYLHK